MGYVHRSRFGLTAALAAFLLLLTGAFAPAQEADSTGEGAAGEMAALLDRSRTVLAAYRDALEPAGWEVAALASSLGDVPEDALTFVHDVIEFEAYPGSLRGAEGALRARAGNALDRSLLLKALLDAGGHKTRLAFAELPTDVARELLLMAAAPGVAGATPYLDLPCHIGDEWVQERRALAIGKFTEIVEARVDAVLEAIEPALGERAARSATDGAGGIPLHQALAWTRAHAWVQVEREGTWIDLDPAVRGAAPGDRLVKASRTAQGPDEGDLHRIQLRVFVERHAGGKVEEQVLFTIDRPAAELSNRAMAFEAVPVSTDAAGDLGSALGGGESSPPGWRAVLRIRGEETAKADFELVEPAKPAGGGGLGGFGGGLGGGGAARPSAPFTTAVGIEVISTGPGSASFSTRRYLFDRWGHAARSSGDVRPLSKTRPDPEGSNAALSRTGFAIAIETGAVSPALLQRRAIESALAIADSLVIANEKVRFVRGAEIGDGAAHLLASTYFHIADAVTLARTGIAGHAHAPRIAMVHLETAEDGDYLTFDVTREPRAFFGGTELDAYRAGILAGIVSAVVEEELTVDPLDPPAAERMTYGVARAMEASAEAGAPLLLTPGRASRVRSPDALARIGEALARGHYVVLPSKPEKGRPLGWFELDPVTGELIATLETGLHGGMAERAKMEEQTPAKTSAATSHGNSTRGLMRCVVENIDTIAFAAIDAGTSGVGIGTAIDAASGVAECLTHTETSTPHIDRPPLPEKLRLHKEKQWLHTPKKPGFDPDRSEVFKNLDVLDIMNKYKGKGKRVGNPTDRKEVVDLPFDIGLWRPSGGGPGIPTSRATFHYRKNGNAHMVPAHPTGNF